MHFPLFLLIIPLFLLIIPLFLLIIPQHTCQRNNMTSTQNKKHKKPQQAVVKAKAKQGLQS
jgi:hypothetical protein